MRWSRQAAAIWTMQRLGRCSSRSRASDPSVFAAVALAGTAVRAYGIAIRPEAALRLDAPVRGSVVLVVERELVRIRTGGHEHAFVPDVQAVHAGRQFGRS